MIESTNLIDDPVVVLVDLDSADIVEDDEGDAEGFAFGFNSAAIADGSRRRAAIISRNDL